MKTGGANDHSMPSSQTFSFGHSL